MIMSRYSEMDFNQVQPISVKTRESKVQAEDLGQPVFSGGTMAEFLSSIPKVLAGKQFSDLVDAIALAVKKKKPVLLMFGAHVIKVGLSPVIIDLMESGIISGIAMNGAGAIHDVELAYFGKTSEDVAASLKEGLFGMGKETADILNSSAVTGQMEELGFGEVLGKRVMDEAPEFNALSILSAGYRLSIPITVHVALGTDIVHQHGSANGAAIGDVSMRDFRIWTHCVSQISSGGVVLLFGSSVILPEVFLKSLTVARNINKDVHEFTTANFDMLRHYRPRVNVVSRPTLESGQGFDFAGHHEIMLPLLAAAIKEKVK